jgi:hypothetical protein
MLSVIRTLMPLSHYALDTFVSQDLSKLTSCDPQSLASEFPERSYWLNQFVLRRIFHNHIAEQHAALTFVLVRRAEAAIDEWELACEAARQGVQKPSGYFKTLRHLESCLAALWQGLDSGRRALATDLFTKGDGSVYERLNWLYNKGRHFDPQALPQGDLHALWLTNDGLHSREHAVTFEEMRDALKVVGGMVDKIAGSSPKSG